MIYKTLSAISLIMLKTGQNNPVNLDVENFDFKNFRFVILFLSVIPKNCVSLPCQTNKYY